MSEPPQPPRIQRGGGRPQFEDEAPVIPLTKTQAQERGSLVRTSLARIEAYKRQGKTIDDIRELMPDFVKSFPKLVEMVMNPAGHNEASLRVMLSMLDRMSQGELTQEDASKIVGQRLVDTYVKPKLRGDGSS